MNFTDYSHQQVWTKSLSEIHRVYLNTDKYHLFMTDFFKELEENNWTVIHHTQNPFDTYVFCHPHQIQLRIAFDYRDNVLSIIWQEELSPALAKLLTIFTISIFFISATFRIVWPSGTYIPEILLIIGLLSALIYLLHSLFKFDNYKRKEDKVGEFFLENVLRYEPIFS